MSWETVDLTREQLYQLVWERPVQDVARSIGVSGVALGKTCRRLGVPVPGRGYWARKAAGQTPRQIPLPAPKPQQPFQYSFTRYGPPKVEDKAEGKRPVAKPEQIPVPDELTELHKLVVMSLPLLRQAKELRENLLEREACLNISVQTHALKDRAIRIMDTLLKALEAHGHSVEVTPPERGQPDSYGRRTDSPSHTVARIGETVVQFGIQEGFDRIASTPKPRRGIFNTYGERTEYKSVPNGKLSLCIHSYHRYGGQSRRKWTDAARQRVENCLGSFLRAVEEIAECERLERIEDERRRIEEEEQRRIREEQARQRALEAARVRDLSRRLHNWTKAQRIRDLAAAVEQNAQRQGETLDSKSQTAEWLEWARSRADRLEQRAIGGADGEHDS
jgi:hypothetical protein